MHMVPNVLATLVSGAIFWIIGGLWYAAIFSKSYQTALGFNDVQKQQSKKSMPAALVMFLIAGILVAYVIGRISLVANAVTFLDGIIVGLWVWIGFALTINVNYLLFEKRPSAIFWINTSFYLIAFALIGGIMAVWK